MFDGQAGMSDQQIAEAIEIANIPTLLMVLVQMTGDQRWLEDPYRPTRNRGLGDNDDGGLDSHVQTEIRQRALEAILAWRRGTPLAIPAPSSQMLVDMLGVSVGENVPLEYADMMAHELGLDERPPNELTPASTATTVPEGFNAVIIGAGASGICAAVKLQEAGIPYVIIERNNDVGGTWFENRYPGAGVDTPSHLYSYSFAKNDWTRFFAAQEELREYFNRVADDFGVRQNIRFGLEVTSAAFNDDAASWLLEVRRKDGSTETLTANIVISAVGAFNKPKMPNIKGLDSFNGPVAHTARWPESLELAGKKVAVIGNGASAMQIVPAIADTVESLVVFQRSPQWAAPFEKFKVPVPERVRQLFLAVPLYEEWYRLRLAWVFNDRIHESLQKDPDWPHPERSINEANDGHRRYFTRHIVSELGDRQDLLDSVLPKYPPFGKRMLLDNGWFRTLTKENVKPVTERVVEVRPEGVVTADGTEHKVDIVILATGFDVVRFLAPMAITGSNGKSLDETWEGDDARAYLGLAIPGFPNFFCLYGPNTQFGHGGSLLFLMELQMHYIMDLLKQMFANGYVSVECRQDVHDKYNEQVDAAHNAMVWTHPGMDVYYRNSRGRVVVNNPFKVVDFWHRLRHADVAEYNIESAGHVRATASATGRGR
ncbi:4-hydroxyacetophenone monooxygenase [Arthrobacter sp. V1I7]|uniref:flavin-containing monooxygenase n=1 Tax=Arthrobacter sp. V1I7 TaxID=3042274 RepID=UPI002788B43E|nr:NAD(P)/FAD-dependent oxidoreductase [Arthrobacter sp. V1I7]MDQ0823773.1 4-hydroxyacetophenone monooxygenase [Arthrobacter sp. V1I7]